MTQRVHLSIPVSDLKGAVAFYQRLFGAEVSKLRSDYANFRMEEPPIHLALVATRPASVETGASHFGVELPDHEQMALWRQRMLDSDAVEDEPGARCCYAVGDKFWVSDPDGHRWEIWVRTGEFDALSEPRSRSGEEPDSASPSCSCECA